MRSKVHVDVRDTFPITLCAPPHMSKLTVPKPRKDNRKDRNLFLPLLFGRCAVAKLREERFWSTYLMGSESRIENRIISGKCPGIPPQD